MLLLTKERRRLKLSQSDLSRATGIHTSSVSNIETGNLKPWPGQIEKISLAMKDAGWNGEGDLFAEVEE